MSEQPNIQRFCEWFDKNIGIDEDDESDDYPCLADEFDEFWGELQDTMFGENP